MRNNLARRMSQLPVRYIPDKSCWVALPAALIARLLQAQAPLPLVLELLPVAPAGWGLLLFHWPLH